MSKIKSSTTKFEVEKFNGKGNFGLWQKKLWFMTKEGEGAVSAIGSS